jgi:inositol oxygenase
MASTGSHRDFEHVRDFNRYGLYSKTDTRPDFTALRPYYEDLVAEFLPDELQW